MNDPSKTVLVVDDDQDICDNITDILDDQGYSTDSAQDGSTALRLLRERLFDIAILDFKMPGMDGAALQDEIRSRYPKVISIMITAHAGSDGVARALSKGIWKVLRKPVDVSVLLDLVKEASSNENE